MILLYIKNYFFIVTSKDTSNFYWRTIFIQASILLAGQVNTPSRHRQNHQQGQQPYIHLIPALWVKYIQPPKAAAPIIKPHPFCWNKPTAKAATLIFSSQSASRFIIPQLLIKSKPLSCPCPYGQPPSQRPTNAPRATKNKKPGQCRPVSKNAIHDHP